MAANIDALFEKLTEDQKKEILGKRDVGGSIALIREFCKVVDDDAALIYKKLKA